MKRAIAAALIASTLMTGLSVARAAEHGGGGGESAETARSMDAPYIAVPVVRDGVLTNYLFVSVRFDIAPGVDLWQTREQAHFLRDALVRACHARSLADRNDPNALDTARATEVFLATARQVLGERTIRGATITSSYSSRGSAH